jgi:crossover junction endodeoxyribonuclease RuvC
MTGGGGGIGATVLLGSLVIVVTHVVSARARPRLRSARHGGPDGTVERVYVLGIDPGLSRCGYGIVHQQAAGVRATAVGVLRTAPTLPTAQRLAELQSDLRALLEEHRPQVVAIERVLFQVNVRTAIPVAQAAGIAMAEAVTAGCEVVEYSPNQVKQAVAGVGGASKDQMERMVQTLLGIAQPLRPVDAADAVALALCHLAHAPMRGRVAQAVAR